MSAYRIFKPEDSAPDNGHMMPTLRECFELYLNSCQKNGTLNADAFAERKRTLRRFADHKFNGVSLGEMTVTELQPYYLTDYIEGNEKWKSTSTRKTKCNAVNAALNWAANGRRIPENPFRSVTYEDAEPREPLLDEHLAKICDAANKPFEELLTFLRLTCRRISEVCQLDWTHIDWQECTVKLEKHKTRRKTKKSQKYALVPEAVDLLLRIKARLTGPPVGIVFLNCKGTPWTKTTAGTYLRRIKERLGIDTKASIHGIRHQAISEMIRNGASIKAVSLQAGHSETRTTERVYCHMADATTEMRDAVSKGIKGITKPHEVTPPPPSQQ